MWTFRNEKAKAVVIFFFFSDTGSVHTSDEIYRAPPKSSQYADRNIFELDLTAYVEEAICDISIVRPLEPNSDASRSWCQFSNSRYVRRYTEHMKIRVQCVKS